MAKRQASLLSFCQSKHVKDKGSVRRRLMMIATKNQMTLIAKMYRLKIAQKNLNIHVMSTLSPQIFGDLSAPLSSESLTNTVLTDPVVYFECQGFIQDFSTGGGGWGGGPASLASQILYILMH